MPLTWSIRDLEAEDLGDLDWSGGPEHVQFVAEVLQRAYAGEVALLVVALANGRLVGLGAVDWSRHPGAGLLWMLAVHETLQGLGLGSALVAALEERTRSRGLARARLAVEHDNPRAAALYRRLGYTAVGSELDGWPTAGGRTYVTVTTVLERDLGGARN